MQDSAPSSRPAVIHKDPAALRVKPHLPRDGLPSFSWAAMRRALAGLPGGALNIAHEAVDRHAQGPSAERVAIHWLGAEGSEQRISYRELQRMCNRLANTLTQLGLARGDRVFVLMPRLPQLYAAVLGGLKAGLVVCPMFSAFGPEPIATRMSLGGARVLITTAWLYRRKVQSMRAQVPSLQQVLLVNDESQALPEATHDLDALMRDASDAFTTVATRPDDPALLHFTSGTTGRPKGALHVHDAVTMHYATGLYALDLHDDDIFWCTADPGWVTGMSYGILAPLAHGVTMIADEAEFNPQRWYRILSERDVTVWYTAPTAIRMLMRAGVDLARRWPRPKLRFIASVGEPLNPEAVWWGQDVLGLPIHDNWWQTETGGIMIANTSARDIKPGSMGRPLPGVVARIVEWQADGGVRVVDTPGAVGELALEVGWPSMFRAYLNEDERYRKCFAGSLYLSGDLATRDADGDYWFVGRADDVIKSAGHLIGPFEVESALMEHPAVVEAGVIGKPDPVLGEMVKAFVTVKPGIVADEALKRDLLAHARKRLGAAVAPKEIAFAATLPRTRSGKIMRRLLKARELGLPEGDTSTLEASS